MGKIYVIIGVSGSGKSTLGETLVDLGIPKLTTHTTRPMRGKEINGKDYHFVTCEEFMEIEKVEHTEYAGNFYGLSVEEVEGKLADGQDCFIIMDAVGVLNMRKVFPEKTTAICVSIPEELVKIRLSKRAKENNSQLRLAQAAEEQKKNIEIADIVIENINLDKAKSRLIETVGLRI